MRALLLIALITIIPMPVVCQVVLNGDFENNTAGVNQINLTNSAYNGFMANSFAFGTFNGGGPGGGNMDIITSNVYCGLAQSGNWYVALTGGGTDRISLTLSVPLVAGQTYSAYFYDRLCPLTANFNSQPIQVGLSTSNNLIGTPVFTAQAAVSGVWTQRSFTFVAPNNGQYLTFQLTAGTGTNTWIQMDNVYLHCSPGVNLGPDTALCSGDTINLDATTLPGASYLWQDNSTDSTFEVTQSGVYSVSVTDNCGTYLDTILVSVDSILNVNLGNDTILCEDDSLLLQAPTDYSTILWQDNTSDSSYLVIQPGVYSVDLVNGCGNFSDTITIGYMLKPNLDLGADTVLCINDTISLQTSGQGISLLWHDGSQDSVFIVSSPGNYWVEASNLCGTVRDSINVSPLYLPVPDLGNDTLICPGDSFDIQLNPNGIYHWNDNSTNSSITVKKSGSYWVTEANICGSNTDTITVGYQNTPIAKLPSDTLLCEGDNLSVDVSDQGSSWVWSDNSVSPQLEIAEEGTYWVIIMNQCGSDSDTIDVKFEKCEVLIKMPNVFSPNGDGVNEFFRPVEMVNVFEPRLIIFNRWGNKMFETMNLENGWDGITNGKLCVDGTYFWIISYIAADTGKPGLQSGSLTLIR